MAGLGAAARHARALYKASGTRSAAANMQTRAQRWAWAVAMATLAAAASADVVVMKDVTLGFGEALQHCREEVGTLVLLFRTSRHVGRRGGPREI